MVSYDFIGDNAILKLVNDGGTEAYIDLSDLSVLKEDDFDSREEFKEEVENLFGYHGVMEELDWED